MTTHTLHPLAAGYLQRLRRAGRGLPPGRLRELLAEIEGHLSEAIDPSASDAQALTVLVGGRLPVARKRMVLARPSATSTIDTPRSLFSVAGVSDFGGGKPSRAIVAEVHPIHHPPHTTRSVSRV